MSVTELMKNHPAADVWPMMDAKRYDELLSDVREHGQREPITICDGMILDGRNRYRACVDLGLEPVTRNFNGDPWALSWSLNGARRDLEDVRRALIKLRCDEESEKIRSAAIAASGRRKMSEAMAGLPAVKKGESRKPKDVADHSEPQHGNGRHVARDARAAEAHVSSSTMARAEFLAKHPDIADKVISGEMKPTEAIRQIKRERIEKEAPAPTGKYRVIYADPPWSYGNTQPDYHTEQRDHYPVMPMSDICAIPVREWAEDDSVLFLRSRRRSLRRPSRSFVRGDLSTRPHLCGIRFITTWAITTAFDTSSFSCAFAGRASRTFANSSTLFRASSERSTVKSPTSSTGSSKPSTPTEIVWRCSPVAREMDGRHTGTNHDKRSYLSSFDGKRQP